MARGWMLLGVAVGVLAASAVAIRPGRWSAGHLAAAVGRQLAAGDAAALAGEAASPLRADLAGGHLEAATRPLRGDPVAAVRVVQIRGATALAQIRYQGGQMAFVAMTDAGGHGWEVTALR